MGLGVMYVFSLGLRLVIDQTKTLIAISTGIICTVRTAFSSQVKSEDVTWEGVPNALARVFEVNLGIVAACAPTMKPLVRYIHARATGKDPREVLLRNTTRSASHSHWYYRLKFGSHGFGTHSGKSEQRNYPFNPGPQIPPPAGVTNTQQSLSLPLQGVNGTESTSDDLEPSSLHGEKSKGSLYSYPGGRHEVFDRV